MRAAGGILLLAGIALALVVPLALGGRAALAGLWQLPSDGIAALSAVVVIGWLARAGKLGLLVRPFGQRLGLRRSLAISLATDCAFSASPAGVAGYPTNAYLLRREGVSWSAASAVVAADQLLDWAFFAVALPVAALESVGADALLGPWREALGAIFLLGVLLVTVAVTPAGRRGVRRAAGALAGRVGALRSRRAALRRFLAELRVHAGTLASESQLRLGALLTLTALQWLSRYGVLWLALAVLGRQLPFSLTLLLQALVLHVAQWSGVPSGAGGADLALAAALAPWTSAATISTALLVWRLATFYVVVLAGGIAFATLRGNASLRQGDAGA